MAHHRRPLGDSELRHLVPVRQFSGAQLHADGGAHARNAVDVGVVAIPLNLLVVLKITEVRAVHGHERAVGENTNVLLDDLIISSMKFKSVVGCRSTNHKTQKL